MSHVYAYFALLGISLVAFIVSIIYLWAKRKSNEKQRIAELTKKKPGFDKFYKDWKKHEDYKHLMKTLRVTGAIVAVTIGVVAVAAKEAVDEG